MKPLTPETERALSQLSLASSDRLELKVTEEGRSFEAEIFRANPQDGQHIIKHVNDALRVSPDEWMEPLISLRAVCAHGTYDDKKGQVDELMRECSASAVTTHLRLAAARLYRDGSKTYASRIATHTFVQRIPERLELHGGMCHWKFAGTDLTAQIINSVWPREQLVLNDESETLLDYLTMSGKQQDINAYRAAEFKKNGTVPEHNLELHPELTLSGYQQLVLINSMSSEGYGLFMDAGTGKTPIVIARICNGARQKAGGRYTAIVVCPKNVRMNWASEMSRFATVQGKVTVMRGGALQRRKCMIDAFTLDPGDKFSVLIISYDQLNNTWEEISMIPWDLAVGDESHYFKSPTTTRFKFMMKLRDISKARMPLTGTPITNNALDLYAHFEFMGKGMSGFLSYKNFRSFHSYTERCNGYDKMVAVLNIPFMKERLARNAFQITLKEAVPDLPEKVYDIREVEMTPRQKEIYCQVRDELALEIEGDLASGRNKSLLIQNVLTKLLRLTQITSGFIVWDPQYDDDGNVVSKREEEAIEGSNPKIVELLEMAAEKTPEDKSIVWACFRYDIKCITAALREAGHEVVQYYGSTSEADREIAEHRFNCDPDCRWLVGNPQAGGVGLNLLGYDHTHKTDNPKAQDTNCNHIIYYSQDWSAVKRTQSEARGHRRGVRMNVRITDLCVPMTIDEEIRVRVTSKITNAMEIADVRALLTHILTGAI